MAVGVWRDGRVGTFRGHRTGPHTYGATVFGEKGVVEAGKFEGYEPLLGRDRQVLQDRQAAGRASQTLEILAFMEAADQSKKQGGQPVKLQSMKQ